MLVGHSSWVHCMVVDNVRGLLWSGSVDGIRVWDPEAPFNNNSSSESKIPLMRSGSSNNNSSKQFPSADCLALLEGHEGPVLSLLAVGEFIWSG